MKQNQPTFLIADDHSIVRQGISLLIKELFFSSKIFHAGSFKEILQIIRETKIDIIILDINFPDGNSLNIITDVKSIQPEVKILIFSAYDEDIYALRYLNAGASGYLNKGSSEDEMKNALKSMMVSGKYITPNVKEKILIPISPKNQLIL